MAKIIPDPNSIPATSIDLPYQAFGPRLSIVQSQIERGGINVAWYSSTPLTEAKYIVTDERQQLITGTSSAISICVLNGIVNMIGVTTNWSNSETYIKRGTVVVRSDDKTIKYVEDIDYTVDYESGIITRTDTSSIPIASYIRIDYNWYQPYINPETGNPRNDSTNSSDGTGVVYNFVRNIIGIFHIPNYSSELTKIGYWEIGDAFFTTTSLYDLKSRGTPVNNLYIRDILVINDGIQSQVWRIITKPQTIQIAGEYIAHKVHIRKIEEGEEVLNITTGVT
jgi:hypothetical protein